MEIQAPSHWRVVECLSDIHLDASDASTFAAWSYYLQHTQADALFILGDLFEVWVGDDALLQADPFLARCLDVLQQAGARLDLHIMAGNRDFLMGRALMQHCHASYLSDPSVLDWGGERVLLTHGDALCLGDTEYLQFRQTVRSAGWQTAFLAQPLATRQAIARDLRAQSEARKQTVRTWHDVDPTAARALLQDKQAELMIHGHTHQPGQHALGAGLQRWVLSDWCLAAQPPRADVLRLQRSPTDGLQISRLPMALQSP